LDAREKVLDLTQTSECEKKEKIVEKLDGIRTNSFTISIGLQYLRDTGVAVGELLEELGQLWGRSSGNPKIGSVRLENTG
jgi:hypothetical protein